LEPFSEVRHGRFTGSEEYCKTTRRFAGGLDPRVGRIDNNTCRVPPDMLLLLGSQPSVFAVLVNRTGLDQLVAINRWKRGY
jgi:hypothetical protein